MSQPLSLLQNADAFHVLVWDLSFDNGQPGFIRSDQLSDLRSDYAPWIAALENAGLMQEVVDGHLVCAPRTCQRRWSPPSSIDMPDAEASSS